VHRPLALLLAAAAASATAQTVVVDSAACRRLVQHQPSADVAYRPGVDSRGRAIASADVNPTPTALAGEFTFDLNVDLAGRVPAGSQLFEPQLGVGRVTIRPDGQVAFNGRPVGDPDRAALGELCARRLRR
jgi:hypothetical protein